MGNSRHKESTNLPPCSRVGARSQLPGSTANETSTLSRTSFQQYPSFALLQPVPLTTSDPLKGLDLQGHSGRMPRQVEQMEGKHP